MNGRWLRVSTISCFAVSPIQSKVEDIFAPMCDNVADEL